MTLDPPCSLCVNSNTTTKSSSVEDKQSKEVLVNANQVASMEHSSEDWGHSGSGDHISQAACSRQK